MGTIEDSSPHPAAEAVAALAREHAAHDELRYQVNFLIGEYTVRAYQDDNKLCAELIWRLCDAVGHRGVSVARLSHLVSGEASS